MGYWGTGNLENDYAAEDLAERTEKMVRAMLRRARRKVTRQWDEYDHTALLVDFEILFALEAKQLLTCDLPAAEEMAKLKASFLKDYDAYTNPDEHGPEFRKALAKTFDRFQRICAKHADD